MSKYLSFAVLASLNKKKKKKKNAILTMVDTKAVELVISSILWHLKYFKTLAGVTCNF